MISCIERYITYMLLEKNKSHNTVEAYRRDILQFANHLQTCGGRSIQSATKTDVLSFLLEMQSGGRAPSSVSRMLTSIRSFYAFLIRSGDIKENPAEGLEAPHIEKKIPKVLSFEQVDRLMKAPDESDAKGCRDKAMLELLYASGIRVSELINLKITDVNTDVRYVRCGARERFIPIGEGAAVAVKRYLLWSRGKLLHSKTSDMLFVNCSGGSISRQGFWKIIKQYGKASGIETEITPHILRHSFAAHLVENGADLKSIQTMMGHADISSTQVYTAFLDNHLREVYERAHPRA